MRALHVFQNRRVQNGRDGVVLVGETFLTDEHHAKELELLETAVMLEPTVAAVAVPDAGVTVVEPSDVAVPPSLPRGRRG